MKLVIRGLNKNYGAKVALQDFHAVFENGIYGILGPNGAGKSTLMNILTDNLLRDSGRILCNETEITKMKAQYRKIMGYMPQQQQLYDSFTVNHFISYMGTLRGMDKKEIRRRMEELLPLLNLSEVRRKKIKELSGGMKQRVLLVQALLDDPQILILDEPTAGLDPKGRDELFDLIRELHENMKMTVLLVSHSMEDVANYVDRIIVLNHGSLMLDGTPAEVFSHVEELERVSLAVPQVTYLMKDLKKAGLDVNTSVTTIEEAKKEIMKLC